MAKVEIFSGPGCSYCDQAKVLLDDKGVEYEDLDISGDEHREELLRRLPRSRAIPQVFVNGEHLGGLEDLRILNKDGRLDRLLASP